jgi:predicted enzyme related to lactoylglutathione lyase
MSARDQYEHGVPCWVDTMQPDPAAAIDFYAGVFGWEFAGPGPGGYHVAQIGGGHDVAGVGTQPEGASSAWNTYTAVDDLEAAIERATGAGGTLVDGPIDASPAGRLAIVADPGGATFGLWQAKDRQGAQRVNESGAWAMSQLMTPDPDAAAAFYGEVFGWTTEEFAPGAWLFRLPGYVGGEPAQPVSRETVAVMMKADGDPNWTVGFWVDDADAAAARAEGRGGSVLMPPTDDPVGRNATLADPTGAAFIVSRVSKPA